MRRRTRHAPAIEEMEPRSLLSAITSILATQSRQVSPNAVLGLVASEQLSAPSSNPSGNVSILAGTNPSPAEQAREKFTALFVGPFQFGPINRFADQKAQTYIRATGTTSVFLHGDLQFLLIQPTDPTKPQFGVAVFTDKNINDSGLLAIDLFADASSTFDKAGRPTHISWSIAPFAGAGSFTAGAFSLASGQGTVDIKYGKPPVGNHRNSLGSQVATVLFRGSLFTPGTFNPLTNANFIQSHDRIL
jgi:hypothetical protein